MKLKFPITIRTARQGYCAPVALGRLLARRRRRAPRRRILALTAFPDEMRFLPGLFDNLAAHVDGIVALDDQSTDGSGAYARSRGVVELITVPVGAHGEN